MGIFSPLGIPSVKLLQLTAVGWRYSAQQARVGGAPRVRDADTHSWVHHPHKGWGGSGLGCSVMLCTGAAAVLNTWAPACRDSFPSCCALKGKKRSLYLSPASSEEPRSTGRSSLGWDLLGSSVGLNHGGAAARLQLIQGRGFPCWCLPWDTELGLTCQPALSWGKPRLILA